LARVIEALALALFIASPLAACATASAPADGPPPAADGPAAPAAAASDAASSDQVTLRARPWAKVAIDGRDVGTTPVKLSLPPGGHTAVFTRGGDSRTERFVVEAGKGLDITVDFGQASAAGDQVTFKARPWATVTLDGKPLGTTPRTVALAPGGHTALFVKGDQSKTERFVVEAGKPLEVMVDFGP
jgi:hypothetical protein